MMLQVVDSDKRWLTSHRKAKIKQGSAKLRMIDLFSGCGGITAGVEAACIELGIQLEPVIAWDIFKHASDVFQGNYPGVEVYSMPIESIVDGKRGEPPTKSEQDFLKKIGDINLIVGGPPCQGNSNLNNHTRGTDPRNLLYLRMARMIEIIKPKYAIIENVAGVRRAKQNVVQETGDWLESIGYSVVEGLIDGEKIGVPQTRKRHFTIASTESLLKLDTFQERDVPERNIAWAIEDLLDAINPNDVFNSPSTANETNLKRMNFLIENGVYDLPPELRPKCHQNYAKHGPSGNTYPAMYGRMYWNKPSPTITTGYSCNGRGRFVHPLKPRCLTPHEAARVQTFPDYFSFDYCKNRTSLNRMLGNAVPPLMAKHIAELLLGGRDDE